MWSSGTRFVRRLCGFGGFVFGALRRYAALRIAGEVSDEDRMDWIQDSARRLTEVLQINVCTHGTIPSEGLIASNHLSYLDIIVIASVAPSTFVSKSEVRYWPIIGLLSNLAGTLYVKRNQRSDVARVGKEITQRLKDGKRVVVFPEGTSSDGSRVLPFHSSLFFPVVAAKRAVTPCHLRYRESGNNPEQSVCYWGNMLFLTHFLKLLTLDFIDAELAFGSPLQDIDDRKALALATHHSVEALSQI